LYLRADKGHNSSKCRELSTRYYTWIFLDQTVSGNFLAINRIEAAANQAPREPNEDSSPNTRTHIENLPDLESSSSESEDGSTSTLGDSSAVPTTDSVTSDDGDTNTDQDHESLNHEDDEEELEV
jgi:hypothetical protein